MEEKEMVLVEYKVQDLDERVTKLEHNYSAVQRELSAVQYSQVQIENTILKTSGEQKELTQKLLDFVLGSKKFNNAKLWQLVLGVFGSGGALYIIIDLALKK